MDGKNGWMDVVMATEHQSFVSMMQMIKTTRLTQYSFSRREAVSLLILYNNTKQYTQL